MSLEEALAEQRELNSKLTLLGLPSSVRVDASRRCAREWSRLSWSERLKLCSRGRSFNPRRLNLDRYLRISCLHTRDTAPTAEESRVVISEVPRRRAFPTPFVRRLCKDTCTALAGRGARTVLLVTSGTERSWYPSLATAPAAPIALCPRLSDVSHDQCEARRQRRLAFGYPRSIFGTLQIDALFAQLGQESQSKLLTIDQLSDSCVSACRCCIGNHHYSVQPGLTLVYVRLRCVRFA